MPGCNIFYGAYDHMTYAQRRAEARRGCRVGVTKPTVAARKAKRKSKARSR